MLNPSLASSQYFPMDIHSNPSILIPGTDEELVYIPSPQSPQQNFQLLSNLAQAQHPQLPQIPVNEYPLLKPLKSPVLSPNKRRKRLLLAHRRKPKTGELNIQRKVRSAIYQEAPPKPIFLSPDGLLYQVLIPANTYQPQTMGINNMQVLATGNNYPALLNGVPVQTRQWSIAAEPYQPNPQIQDLGVIERILDGHPKRRHILKVRRRKRVHPIVAEVVTEQTPAPEKES